MAYILTLEISDEADLKLLLELARRMGIEAAVKQVADKLSEADQERLLHEVFGSWKSDVSGEEMVREIYTARQDAPRDVDL